MMEFEFSEIDEDDLVACSEVFVATFREAPWNEEWGLEDAIERLGDFLATPKSLAIKATRGEELCGFVFGKVQQWNGTQYYDLDEMCVSSVIQRQGLGRKLMNDLERRLGDMGVSRIYLITQRDSGPASFYDVLGFSENQDLLVMGRGIG